MAGTHNGTGGVELSVGWQDGLAGTSDETGIERAAVYASLLARRLVAAGYEPRKLSISLRQETAGVLQLSVLGRVDEISAKAFSIIARDTLIDFGADDLVVVAQLDRPQLAQPAPAPAPSAAVRAISSTPKGRGEGPPVALVRLVVGLTFGLLLGFLGLPRIDLPLPTLSNAARVVNPTAVIPEAVAVEQPALILTQPPLPTPPPPPTATALPKPTATLAGGPRVLFAERFVNPLAGWPNDIQGTAWFGSREYRLFARDPGRFVATGIPLPQPQGDVRLSAQFHKVNGPAGGGYGFIVRDQTEATSRDGRSQAGEYIVLEVDDRGDVGIWRRDQTRWIDLVPWTHSDAVRVDNQPNVLVATTHGRSLRFEVNGEVVAERTYDQLPPFGGVGLFVGGDLNEVALEWLRIEAL